MTQPWGPLPNIDMDLARTFVAICESGNFSRAAERVHRTPSAISLQVKKLEAMLGRELFRRETRSVALTADGELLLGYARRLLRLNDEAVSHFLVPAMEGRVHLGAPTDAGTIAIPEILKRFAATHPHVQVDVRLDTGTGLQRRFEAGELDVAILSCEDPADTSRQVIHTEPLAWIGCRHGCAHQRDPLPLALADLGCSWRAMALEALDRAGTAYRIAYSSEHCLGQAAAVEADLAVAPLPLSVVSATLVRLGEGENLPPLGDYRIFLKTREGAGAAADALAAHVTERFREMGTRNLRLLA